jgi:hypothetical protein
MGCSINKLGGLSCRHCINPGLYEHLENFAAEKIGNYKPYRHGQAASQQSASQFLQMLQKGHFTFFVDHLRSC